MSFFQRAKGFLTKKTTTAPSELPIGSPNGNGLRSDADGKIPVQNGLIHSSEEQAKLFATLVPNGMKAVQSVTNPSTNPDLGSGKPLGVYHLHDDRVPGNGRKTDIADGSAVSTKGTAAARDAFRAIDDPKAFVKEFDTAIDDALKTTADANSLSKPENKVQSGAAKAEAFVSESKMWESGSAKKAVPALQHLEVSPKSPTVGDHRISKNTR
jgi:hypothetical protein